MRTKASSYVVASLLSLFTLSTYAETATVSVYPTAAGASQKSLGTVIFEDTPYGLLITPDLKGLSPGLHGFHIHINPSCADKGMAAGGHLDPQKTDKHAGPYAETSHLGDLPALYVDAQEQATHPELAPRLKVSDIKHHALMIHAGGDNYSDHPTLGGGGARIACGVIQ